MKIYQNYPPIRLDKLIDRGSDPPHWIWLGAVFGPGVKTYARSVDGKTTSARRAVWELLFGELPDNKRVNKTCDVPLCVGPNCSKLTNNGESRGSWFYSEADLDLARELLKNPNNTQTFISRHTGIGRRTIWELKKEMNETKE